MLLRSCVRRLLFFMFFGVISLTAGARGYYVSASRGDDRGPGTYVNPFKSIRVAARIAEPGDTCYILPGIYRELVMPILDGTPNNPIVYMAYGDRPVVVAGSDMPQNWARWRRGVWKSYSPGKVIQLFVDGQRENIARFPDKISNDLFDVSDWADVYATSSGEIRFSEMDLPENYWVGGICRFLTGKRWIMHYTTIAASKGNVVQSAKEDAWRKMNPDVYLKNGIGCIYHINALDHPGEWFWQNDTLYYFPRKGEDPNNLDIEARVRIDGFLLRGKKFIVVKGLSFFMATVDIEESEGCVLEGCNILYPTPFFLFRSGWCRNQGGGIDFSINHWEGKGVSVSGKENVIRDCYVARSWGDGISVGGRNNRTENCLVEECDWSATDAAAISVTGHGHTIIRCTLRRTARSILLNRYAGKTDVLYNDLGDAGLMCEDLGITYSYHTNGDGSQIAYNRVHDNHAESTASGIYLDNYDTSYIVHHNIIWNAEIAIQTNKPAVGHRIYNNTAWHCGKAMHAWGREGTAVQDQIVVNNLSDKKWDVGTVLRDNLTIDDPLFRDAEHGDFSLREGSPAIDRGEVIAGITDDYRGEAPDVGACEYGAPPWRAGSTVKRVGPDEIIKYMLK